MRTRKEMREAALAILEHAERERLEAAQAEAERNNPHNVELTAAIRFVWEQRASDNWAWCKIEQEFGLVPAPFSHPDGGAGVLEEEKK